jgi:hypothetical protein
MLVSELVEPDVSVVSPRLRAGLKMGGLDGGEALQALGDPVVVIVAKHKKYRDAHLFWARPEEM